MGKNTAITTAFVALLALAPSSGCVTNTISQLGSCSDDGEECINPEFGTGLCAKEVCRPEPLANALNAFSPDVETLVVENCAQCHGGGGPGPGWAAPDPDVYSQMLRYGGLINIDSLNDSTILTKGVHDGPELNAEQYVLVRRWIEFEVLAVGGTLPGRPETTAQTVTVGPNSIALDGAGGTGAFIDFDMELVVNSWLLNNMVVRTTTNGIIMDDPKFIVINNGVRPPDDQVINPPEFSLLAFDMQAGEVLPFSDGTLGLSASAGAQLVITFGRMTVRQ